MKFSSSFKVGILAILALTILLFTILYDVATALNEIHQATTNTLRSSSSLAYVTFCLLQHLNREQSYTILSYLQTFYHFY